MFEYKEDALFFSKLLECVGGLEGNMDLFDFRDPVTKRQEFNKIRNKVFSERIGLVGNVCELACHVDCLGVASQIDHLIPLSSNVLNKNIRKLKPEKHKKVRAQSFGSNNSRNLVNACTRCNAYKKHRFPEPETIVRLLGVGGD